jgi:hypothetical protein
LVTWNFLDRELQSGAPYPVLRLAGSPLVAGRAIP